MNANTHKELHTGTDGRGNTAWLVVTVNEAGAWTHVETFDTPTEAASWLKWA